MDRFRGWWILQILVCSTSCINYPRGVTRILRQMFGGCCLLLIAVRPPGAKPVRFFFSSYSSSFTQIRASFSPSFRLPRLIVILSVLEFPTASLLAIFSLSRLFISPPPSSSRDVAIVFRRREWGEGGNNALNPE